MIDGRGSTGVIQEGEHIKLGLGPELNGFRSELTGFWFMHWCLLSSGSLLTKKSCWSVQEISWVSGMINRLKVPANRNLTGSESKSPVRLLTSYGSFTFYVCRQRGSWRQHVLPPFQDLDLPQPEDSGWTYRSLPGSGGGGGGGGVLRLTVQRGNSYISSGLGSFYGFCLLCGPAAKIRRNWEIGCKRNVSIRFVCVAHIRPLRNHLFHRFSWFWLERDQRNHLVSETEKTLKAFKCDFTSHTDSTNYCNYIHSHFWNIEYKPHPLNVKRKK